ncbi:hypothetical protein AVEN_218617-1, partial [Araneus ventricosus]
MSRKIPHAKKKSPGTGSGESGMVMEVPEHDVFADNLTPEGPVNTCLIVMEHA